MPPCCCRGISTDCCEDRTLPTTLIGAVNAFSSGAFNAMAGTEFDLDWDAGTSKWVGTISGVTVRVYCDAGTWRYDVDDYGACNVTGSTFNPTIECEPFNLAFGSSNGDCGQGTLIFEVYE